MWNKSELQVAVNKHGQFLKIEFNVPVIERVVYCWWKSCFSLRRPRQDRELLGTAEMACAAFCSQLSVCWIGEQRRKIFVVPNLVVVGSALCVEERRKFAFNQL